MKEHSCHIQFYGVLLDVLGCLLRGHHTFDPTPELVFDQPQTLEKL